MKHLHHLFLSCLLLTFCLTFTQCEKPLLDSYGPHFFYFVNLSDKVLDIRISSRSQDTLNYWDTVSYSCVRFENDDCSDQQVQPFDMCKIRVPKKMSPEEYMIENPLIHVFVGCLPDAFPLPNTILKRYDLTIDSFVQKNWTLVYP